MNRKQRIVIWVGIVLVALIGLNPPWEYTLNRQEVHSKKPAGSYFILDDPKPEQEGTPYSAGHGIQIDGQRLFLRWMSVIIVVAGLIFILRDSNQPPSPPTDQTNGGES